MAWLVVARGRNPSRLVAMVIAAAVFAGCGGSTTEVGFAANPPPSAVPTPGSSVGASKSCANLPAVTSVAATRNAESMRQLISDDQVDESTLTPLYGSLRAEPINRQDDIASALQALHPSDPESKKAQLERDGFAWSVDRAWTGTNGDGVTLYLVALRDDQAAVDFANDHLRRARANASHMGPTQVLAGGVRFYGPVGPGIEGARVIGVVGNVEVHVVACSCTPGVDPLQIADRWAAEVANQFSTQS